MTRMRNGNCHFSGTPSGCSGWGDAVVAGEGIGPLWIGEVVEAVGQGEGLERNPVEAGQVGGGLDDDGDIGCAGDVEAELVVFQPKVGVGGLYPRVPEDGGKSGEGI